MASKLFYTLNAYRDLIVSHTSSKSIYAHHETPAQLGIADYITTNYSYGNYKCQTWNSGKTIITDQITWSSLAVTSGAGKVYCSEKKTYTSPLYASSPEVSVVDYIDVRTVGGAVLWTTIDSVSISNTGAVTITYYVWSGISKTVSNCIVKFCIYGQIQP